MTEATSFSFMLSSINGRTDGTAAAPSFGSAQVLPGRVEATVPGTFMMSAINGRAQLKGIVRDCCEKCVGIVPATFVCRRCGFICDICMRTICTHTRGDEVKSCTGPSAANPMPASSFCNSCGMKPLPVPYYHCIVCPDYDHCPACEEINDDLAALARPGARPRHDPTHAMIKYRRPHS